jgi:hypothetical protein
MTDDDKLNWLIRRALIEKGRAIPETEEEVEAFERSGVLDDVELPEALKDPPEFLSA